MPDLVELPRWRALIYNRASSDKTGARVSVESQDVENHAWCAREGWEVAGVVTDNDRSATRFAVKDREGFREIREGLGTSRWGRVDILVTVASSRNQRRLDGYVELREVCERNDVRLAYNGRVYDMSLGADRFATGLDALIDERAAEDIREGILRSHRNSVAAGKPRGSIPFGYTREYNPGTRRMNRQIPDPRTAAVVKGIVADILAGKTLYSIAQRLNADGVATPQAERDRRRELEVVRPGWSSSMLRNMLSKPTLAGFRTHNGVTVGPGDWEPIVSPDDWRAVQALLKGGALRTAPGREVRHLLSGIAECGVCGAWLRPLTNRGRPTYICAGKVPSASKGHVHRSRPPLDAMVTVRVVELLLDPDLLVRAAKARVGDERRASSAERELADLRAARAEYVEAAKRPGGRGAAAALEIIADYDEQIEACRARMGAASGLPQAVLAMAGPGAAETWRATKDAGDLATLRLATRSLVRVVVHRSTQSRGARGFDDASVEVTRRRL